MRTIKIATGAYEYDPSKPLGRRGGFGQVFAGNSLDGGEVAIKKLHLSAADAAHRELRIAEELKERAFEHVVAFIDAGEDADTGDYFVVMPRAEGSLQGRIERDGGLTPAETAAVMLQIVKGLIEVGELVHRDLKPDNVLLHEGKWKIADFGIARFIEEVTASNTLKDYLSPYYAAPEQWRLERSSHATDIYALGCIAFCLLVGKPPFTNDPSSEHQTAPVPLFTCAEPRLTTLVNMCLRKVAASRPSLTRLRDLLTDIVKKPQVGVTPSADLASVAAQISSKQQQEQARHEAEVAARNARQALAQSAYEMLADSAERLWGKIHSQAANANRISSARLHSFKVKLGHAFLTLNLSHSCREIEPGLFKHSGWDVAASSRITLRQDDPCYEWSASLWYVRMKKDQTYRWVEAGYRTQLVQPLQCEPFAASIEDADFAASSITHSVAFAYGPMPADDESEDEFHQRWIWLLSKAAAGRLRCPSRMPFGWPPPF